MKGKKITEHHCVFFLFSFFFFLSLSFSFLSFSSSLNGDTFKKRYIIASFLSLCNENVLLFCFLILSTVNDLINARDVYLILGLQAGAFN